MSKVAVFRDQEAPYEAVFGDGSKIIDAARESAARSVTAAYWLIGHRIVEFEQSGEERAEYGTALIVRLAADITRRLGRGFSRQNVQQMRLFYLSHPPDRIRQALSGKSEASHIEMGFGGGLWVKGFSSLICFRYNKHGKFCLQ